MNSILTTLERPTSRPRLKTILAQEGYRCSLLSLEPGAEVTRDDPTQLDEQILFVVAGEATVRLDAVNTMLRQDEALLIPQGKAHTLVASNGAAAKLLRVEIPPRQVITPQILSFDS